MTRTRPITRTVSITRTDTGWAVRTTAPPPLILLRLADTLARLRAARARRARAARARRQESR